MSVPTIENRIEMLERDVENLRASLDEMRRIIKENDSQEEPAQKLCNTCNFKNENPCFWGLKLNEKGECVHWKVEIQEVKELKKPRKIDIDKVIREIEKHEFKNPGVIHNAASFNHGLIVAIQIIKDNIKER